MSETSFSPKGAAKIPGLSLSEFLFSLSPRSVGSGNGGDKKKIEREGRIEGVKSRQRSSKTKEYSGGAVEGGEMGCWHMLALKANLVRRWCRSRTAGSMCCGCNGQIHTESCGGKGTAPPLSQGETSLEFLGHSLKMRAHLLLP